MQNKYIKPSVKVVSIQAYTILAGSTSLPTPGGNPVQWGAKGTNFDLFEEEETRPSSDEEDSWKDEELEESL